MQAFGALAPAVGVSGVGTPLQAGTLTSVGGAARPAGVGVTGSQAEALVTPVRAPAQVPASVPVTRAEPVTAPTSATNVQEGKATFLSYEGEEWGERPCAHPTLPMGTLVTVTNLNNGKSATCVVQDQGPFGGGRVIDLDLEVFAELADPAVGVIPVRLSW